MSVTKTASEPRLGTDRGARFHTVRHGQPQIEVVTRDRGGAYALAAARALPEAVQVADRWHLTENASQAFLAATRACMRQVRAALGAATVDPRLLTAAEKLQYQGYLRREDVNAAVLALQGGQADQGNCSMHRS